MEDLCLLSYLVTFETNEYIALDTIIHSIHSIYGDSVIKFGPLLSYISRVPRRLRRQMEQHLTALHYSQKSPGWSYGPSTFHVCQ